jgi:hypothetical protein
MRPGAGPVPDQDLAARPGNGSHHRRERAKMRDVLETPEARLVQAVKAAVDRHHRELAQLVDAELDRALDTLVAERIAARNGAVRVQQHAHDRRDDEPAGPRMCKDCRVRPASSGRTQCNSCRHRGERQRARERRHAATGPVLAPSEEPPQQPGHPEARNGS